MSFLNIVHNRVPCNMSSLVISFSLLACMCVCVWIHVCICMQRPEVNIGCFLCLCLSYFLRQLLNLELTWVTGRSSCLHSPVHAAIPGFVWGCRDGARFSDMQQTFQWLSRLLAHYHNCEVYSCSSICISTSFLFIFYFIIGILSHYLNFIPLLRYKFWLFTCHLMDI